ncbi:nucleoside-diphosphate kinase [Vagococcus fluvialis]|uniref:nucleoside-diphosphate kinase n=1 Tax=Vagococcus fluvialis TaxID=2738 RepID=UPI001432D7E7|nr:nucleoside-diphosphate kinase [Vagococcus fluvialis]NKC58486.1 nucleoside-diphosphate kinase [Vagococcus fluvialis]NKD49282.1 nucleoside-diphosphate kinase [Vagococcus fluvialis]
MEQTLVIIKPDGVQKRLVGEIISRFEKRGFTIKNIKMEQLKEDVVKEHYAHLKSEPFFMNIVKFMTSCPVVCLILESPLAVQSVRQMVGATNPQEALPGTIRSDFGFISSSNIIHASDSIEAAEIEIKRFF